VHRHLAKSDSLVIITLHHYGIGKGFQEQMAFRLGLFGKLGGPDRLALFYRISLNLETIYDLLMCS
jgi:hypothetical protein